MALSISAIGLFGLTGKMDSQNSREGLSDRCAERVAHQPRRTNRSRRQSSQIYVPKSTRSCGREAASDCMRVFGGFLGS